MESKSFNYACICNNPLELSRFMGMKSKRDRESKEKRNEQSERVSEMNEWSTSNEK